MPSASPSRSVPELPAELAAVAFPLASDERRRDVVRAATTFFVALDQPAQIRHAPTAAAHLDAAAQPDEFVRGLAAAARPRATAVHETSAPVAAEDQPIGERRSHVLVNNRFRARVLALTRWPATVGPNWLAPLLTDARIQSVVLHTVPVPADQAARMLRRRLSQFVSTQAVDDHTGRLRDPRVAVAHEAADAMWTQLARGDTALHWAQLLVVLGGEDPAALTAAHRDLRTAAAALGATVTPLWFEQLAGWRAAEPGGAPVGRPPGPAWRLLDAATLGCTVPWPVGPPPDADGVLCGVEPASGGPVLCDRFNLHNANRLVVGTSGAGKSFAAKLEVSRWLGRGVDAIVVDPEGEFRALAVATGGTNVVVGVDPAGVDPVAVACSPRLTEADGLALLASVLQALLGAPLSAVDLAVLDRAFGVLRADVGGRAGMRELVDVVADVCRFPPFTGGDLAARLQPAAAGSLATLFAPNPVLAEPRQLVVFDLRAVAGRLRAAVTAAVLGYAWTRTVGPADARRLLVVDEAHLLLDDPHAAVLLAQFTRRARKYGIGLELVTQRLSDFIGNPAGEAALANTATKLLLGCEDRERGAVARGLDLCDREAALLRPGTIGTGLLLTPSGRCAVRVVATPDEWPSASAGPGGARCDG